MVPATPETPMEIFLSERYRTLNLAPGGPLTPEQKQIQEQLRLQKKVETFFSEGCLVRASLMGAGGGVLGEPGGPRLCAGWCFPPGPLACSTAFLIAILSGPTG